MVVSWAPPLVDGEANPTLAEEVSAVWPVDPLGPRRAAVADGAPRWSGTAALAGGSTTGPADGRSR